MDKLKAKEKMVYYKCSANHLLATALRSGDINFRFSSRSSAIEGIRGHQKLQRSRAGGYQAEVTVSGEYEWNNSLLQVGGRMDGVYADTNPVIIDEIKTLRVSHSDLPESIRSNHWAQAKIYGWLYAQEHKLQELILQLSYYNLDSGESVELQESFIAVELKMFFEGLAKKYLQWMEKIQAWKETRNHSIAQLNFPYGDFRSGQRTFAVSAYRAMASSKQLFVQAPTGIGKTIGTLFPAIKAIGEGHHEKIFFLTAKTLGREVAETTVADMTAQGLQLRSVTLTAKDKICFNPGLPCDPEQCQYARGYYDKLDAVLKESFDEYSTFSREQIEAIARKHDMCPFELSLDISSWVDCIICDYNYVFDPVVYLRRFFDEPQDNYCFLVDEAHNLVDRGRDMFSAEIEKEQLMVLKRKLKATKVPSLMLVVKKLDGVNRAFLNMRNQYLPSLDNNQYAHSDQQPTALIKAMRSFTESTQQWLGDNDHSSGGYQELLTFYFEVLRFIRTAEYFDSHYVCLIKRLKKNSLSVKLYCVDPSSMLAKGLERAGSTIFFSATLNPVDYYQNLLGVDSDSTHVNLPSPFPKENLGVFVIKDIATNYRHRDSSYDKIVEVIKSITMNHTGNYLIYFPSYQYMEKVFNLFKVANPAIKTLIQNRSMTEQSRLDFLDQFDAENGDLLVGFAVMGGIFSEGIDLKGKRLVGVAVIGVGLPQLGIDRDLIKSHFDNSGYNSEYICDDHGKDFSQNGYYSRIDYHANSQRGFEYAYQYPGMVRVLQTAGRVIRSEQDRGIVCLIDDRFAQSRYRRLFPEHWSRIKVISQSALAMEVKQFWSREPENQSTKGQ